MNLNSEKQKGTISSFLYSIKSFVIKDMDSHKYDQVYIRYYVKNKCTQITENSSETDICKINGVLFL